MLRDLEGTELLVADKVFTIIGNAANDYVSGLRSLALGLFVIGAALFALAVLWPTSWGASLRGRLGLTKTRAPP